MKRITDFFEKITFEGETFQEELMYSPEATAAFVKYANERDLYAHGISMPDSLLAYDWKSVRKFNEETLISYADFSTFLAGLQSKNINGIYKYHYPSAGGLYPIDIFIYVKENRIENVKQGLYQYHPLQNTLRLVSTEKIPATLHYYGNRHIFSSSAFSVYLFYVPSASYPKYGGMGMFYGILDCGILLEFMGKSARKKGIGSCIIGNLDFQKFNYNFSQEKERLYLCNIEMGLPLQENENAE